MANERGFLRVRNWGRYQHYKDRNPPWIKFYIALLDDDDVREMPVTTRLLWDQLLLLAGRFNNTIEYDEAAIAIYTKLPVNEVAKGVLNLLSKGMLIQTRTRRKPAQAKESTDSNGASNGASAGASPSTEVENYGKGTTLTKQQQESKEERSTPLSTRETREHENEAPAAAEPEAPREARVRAICAELAPNDANSIDQILPLALAGTSEEFEDAVRDVSDRKSRNPAGLLHHLLTNNVKNRQAVYARTVAEASLKPTPETLGRVEWMKRYEPEEWVKTMAKTPGFGGEELTNYLSEYVKDEVRRAKLVRVWETETKGAAAA